MYVGGRVCVGIHLSAVLTDSVRSGGRVCISLSGECYLHVCCNSVYATVQVEPDGVWCTC